MHILYFLAFQKKSKIKLIKEIDIYKYVQNVYDGLNCLNECTVKELVLVSRLQIKESFLKIFASKLIFV